MIVDMIQNDVSGIAEDGTVTTRTSKTRTVEMLARLDRAQGIEELTKLSATWSDAAEAGRSAATSVSVKRFHFQKTAHRDMSNRATIDRFDASSRETSVAR